MQSKIGQPHTFAGRKSDPRTAATVHVLPVAQGVYEIMERASLPAKGSDMANQRVVHVTVQEGPYHALLAPANAQSNMKPSPDHALVFIPFAGYFELIQLPISDLRIVALAKEPIPYREWGTITTRERKIEDI